MKETHVKWIGEIPNDWSLVRFKDLYFNQKEVVGDKSSEYERLALTLNGVIKRNKDDSEGLQPKEFDGYQIIRPNDFIFKMIDLQNISTSRVGLSPYEGLVSPAYIRFTPKNKNQFNKFIYYYLMSLYYNCVYNNLGGNGVRSSLSATDMGNFVCPYPNVETQIRISDYLDKKIDEINHLVDIENTQIEKLKEYKNSLVVQIVTKGLNHENNFVDSNIEWIGKYPSNWKLVKLGSLFNLRNEKVSDKDYMPLSVSKNGVVPQIETVAKSDASDDRKLVLKGDFAINSRSDRKMSCGVSDLDGSVSLINTILYPKNNKIVYNKYLNYLLKNYGFAEEFYRWGHGIVADLWTTKWQEMKNILLPLPPFEEQKNITDYLDLKLNEIDATISIKQNKIENIIEFKKSLIYECVTGKKEVAA